MRLAPVADLPKGWTATPLKYLASSSGGLTPSKDKPKYWDGDVPWVTPKDMKRPVLADSQDHVSAQALAETGLKLHAPDGVMVVTRGMILAHTFPVARNSVPVTVNQDMKVLRPGPTTDARYLAWLLEGLSPVMLSLTDESAHGTKALRTDQWENLPVPMPKDRAQQERIANFLDEQTARIDTLIAEKEKLVERLDELRLSCVSAAVGGGSSPETAPGADLSRLFPAPPAGWRLTRLGFLASKIGSGKTPSGGAEVYLKEGIPLIRSMNVYDEGMRMDDVAYISPEMDEELATTRLEENDILLNITGASIGRTCLVPANVLPANINQHTCIVRLMDKRLAPYVSLALKSAQTKAQIEAFQNGAAREGLNFAQVSCITILLPATAEEADKVAGSVERTLSAIDAARTHTSEHVERLREYRSSLISAAVTGQLELDGMNTRREERLAA